MGKTIKKGSIENPQHRGGKKNKLKPIKASKYKGNYQENYDG
jgi:hypothetical protein